MILELDISQIDFELLKDQKFWLINQSGFDKPEIPEAEGLLNFIDWFQDAVVAQGLKSEGEVFRLTDD